MKIGFVLDDGMDKTDGVQQYILSLGDWYKSHGHQVSYLVGQTNRENIPGVYSLSKNIGVRFNGNVLSVPLYSSTKEIKKFLNEEQFDVLHVQVPYSPIMAGKIIKHASDSTAVIGTFHILPYGILSKTGTFLLGKLQRNTIKRFDAMVSVSRPAAEFAEKTYGVKSIILPNSIDLKTFRRKFNITNKPERSEKENIFRILFLGRLVPRKGAQQLLRSLHRLHKQGYLPEGTKVDICGDGPMKRDLENYVIDKQLSFVTFHGFVSNQEKIRFMQQSDIAIFPSLSGESFGIVLIEAIAAGSGVVLGGNNPGYRSVLGDIDGSIINTHKTSEFASSLADLMKDENKRREMHERQQAIIDQYDTENVASKLLELYESCKSNRLS